VTGFRGCGSTGFRIGDDSIDAVIKAIPLQFRALFVVLAATGLRIGEALGLKWADIDFDPKEPKLHVRRSIWRGQEQTPKSKRSMRAKHMSKTLVQALRGTG